MTTYKEIREWQNIIWDLQALFTIDKQYLEWTREWLEEWSPPEPEEPAFPKFMWTGGTQSSAYVYHTLQPDQTHPHRAYCGEFDYAPVDARLEEPDYQKNWVTVVGDDPPDSRYRCARCLQAKKD